jgi:hypothetical protein
MSVRAVDENKVFGITFRTPPSDSTGIPHILEVSNMSGLMLAHARLCITVIIGASIRFFVDPKSSRLRNHLWSC